jgi:hypothetical protein
VSVENLTSSPTSIVYTNTTESDLFLPSPSVPVSLHRMRLSLRRVLLRTRRIETTNGSARLEVRLLSGGRRVASGAVDDSSGPEVGVEGHGEEEGEGVEEVEVCLSSSMGKSARGKSRKMEVRKRTDFVSDEVARVTLSVLNGTEGAADEDSDAGDEEDPEEDAPVVDEFR